MSLATPGAALAAVVQRTAARTGVQIRELDTPAAAAQGAEVLRAVWSSSETVAPANLLRAIQHAGGYVFGAYDDNGVMLATSVAFLATEGLHSHITGVVPTGHRQGLGLALKQHQRAWALERGITTITWTCDPLVRRNLGFNLHALGATVEDYLTDFYGPMTDGVNQGDETDRVAVRWDLLAERAVAAEHQRLPWVSSDAPLAVEEQHGGGAPAVHPVAGPSRRVQLPGDIETSRRRDPEVARAWRLAVREAVVEGMRDGAVVVGLTADGALAMQAPS